MQGVPDTAEFRRILALPRRPPEPPADAAELLTRMLRTPNGTVTLRPLQAMAILEAVDNQGLFGLMPVGSGKTIPSLVIPVAMEAKRPVLFVPAALRDKAIAEDIPEIRKHFRLHCNLKILSYDMLSSPKASQLLDEIKPDLILLDEAHKLKNPQAVRTKRFLQYLKQNPETRLVALSGTMTTQSLFDFAHLCQHALKGKKCPIPVSYVVLNDWDAALGAGQNWATQPPMDPGVLLNFCAPGENARQGFFRRLTETPGVVATQTNDVPGVAVRIQRAPPLEVPEKIEAALKELRKTWRTAWGEEVESGLALAKHARELASGFYYRWKWPNGIPDREWLFARAEWHKELREWLKRPEFGTLGPANVAKKIIAGELESDTYWTWAKVRDRYGSKGKGPPVEAVWIDTFLVTHAQRWMAEHPRGIAWFQHRALGYALKAMGVKVFMSEDEMPKLNDRVHVREAMACAIKGHGTGKNLQWWHCDNLTLSCPSSGDTWEQLVGRTHRTGQASPVVNFEVLLHTSELEDAWGAAVNSAEYMQDTTGTPQKILNAERQGLCASLSRLWQWLSARRMKYALAQLRSMCKIAFVKT